MLERAAAGDGPPPPLAWCLSAAHQVAAGLAHLHARRVAHWDLKPANVMLNSPETGFLLQLTDFGLAREVGTGGSVRGTMGGGAAAHDTVAWMAPELLQAPAPGQPPVRPSFRTDVYALGVLAWQLLALAPHPFPGLSEEQARAAVARGDRPILAALPEGVPEPLRALIARCWDAAPGARPRSAGDVLEALLVVSQGGGRHGFVSAFGHTATVKPKQHVFYSHQTALRVVSTKVGLCCRVVCCGGFTSAARASGCGGGGCTTTRASSCCCGGGCCCCCGGGGGGGGCCCCCCGGGGAIAACVCALENRDAPAAAGASALEKRDGTAPAGGLPSAPPAAENLDTGSGAAAAARPASASATASAAAT